MRIIAGEFASRKLETKKGNSTRPTLDKVKEAVFSSLGTYFNGGNVLDLYAGSGAIGLEALSRGVTNAYFSDMDRQACHIIKANIQTLGVQQRCHVYPISDKKMLQIMKEENMKFDLVYIDPPYAKQKNFEILQYLDDNAMVNAGGNVVIESNKDENYQFDCFRNLKFYKEAIYGISKITYYKVQ